MNNYATWLNGGITLGHTYRMTTTTSYKKQPSASGKKTGL